MRGERIGRGGVPGLPLLLGLLLLMLGASPGAAQTEEGTPTEEERLRQAASLEARDDLRGAGEALRALLDDHPGSTAGVFALERVLRTQDRVAEVLPVVDAYLRKRPEEGGMRYLKLRLLVEVDSTDALTDAAEAWLSVAGDLPDPYRDVARIYEQTFGPEPALEILERGRESVVHPASLSEEAAGIRLRAGDLEGAAREWARSVGPRGASAGSIQRFLRRLDRPDRQRAGAILVSSLEEEPTTVDRRRVAVQMALVSGFFDDALRLARELLPELRSGDRAAFLTDLGRRAEEVQAVEVALWSYRELRSEVEGEGGETIPLDEQVYRAALTLGDTALALEARLRITGEMERGGPERRRSFAEGVRLSLAAAPLSRAEDRLRAFREEFPGAPETDELTAELAHRHLQEGSRDQASRILEGEGGPRSSLERAFLHLEEGRAGEGRMALLQAADALPPDRATEAIELARTLGRIEEAGAAEIAGEAAASSHRGRPHRALASLDRLLEEGVLSRTDRAPVLALAARIAAEKGDGDGATAYRETLVRDHRESMEASEATLHLARHRARGGDEGKEEAIRLLETLILEAPGSTVAPEARRELQRIRERIPPREGGP